MTDDEYLAKCVNESMEHPQHYWGAITDLQDQGWGQTFGRHRDSDNIDLSNFETILKYFEEKGYELNDDYRIEGSSHWAVGWTDSLMVRIFDCKCEDWEDADISYNPSPQADEWYCETCMTRMGIEDIRPIFHDCLDFKHRLEEYPLLDEEDHSRREHEDLMDWLEQETSSLTVHLQNDERVADDFEADVDEVARYLFDEHSVSSIDDCNSDWIEDAILAIADREGSKL